MNRSIYSILTHLNVPSKMTSTLFSTHNVGRLYDWLGLIALVFVVNHLLYCYLQPSFMDGGLRLVDHVFTRTLLSIAAITTGYIYLFFAWQSFAIAIVTPRAKTAGLGERSE